MSKKLLALISAMSLIITMLPQTLVKAEINTAAVDYLKGQTQDAWVTMALAAAEETGLDLSHLESVSGKLATDYEKAILALVAAGEDPATFGNIDYVNKLKTHYYSASQIGDVSLLNDDIWGILALSAAGESINSQIMQDAKSFLLTNQNQDGGWGYGVGGDSDTNDTASAIMALLEVGLTSQDQEILDAIEYLKNQQNDDGGFPYTVGSQSDSGSDSWVISAIYKLGEDPTSTDWQNNSNNAIDHLKSLQKTDGSFKWIASDETSYTSMTAFAVIALAEKYYPIIGQQKDPGKHNLRIEGSSSTVCNTQVSAATALDTIINGALVCGYTYEIQDTGLGPYLFSLNGEEAAGVSGWMYFVNNISPLVGAADYILETGDEVLWYYGQWGWLPTRLSLNKSIVDLGEDIEILAEYHNGVDWLVFPQADIMVGADSYLTDGNGKLTLTMEKAGVFEIFVASLNYVRSNKESVIVGLIDDEVVGLEVEIEQVAPPEISFEVSVNHLNFGTMSPGEQEENDLTLFNTGQTPIYVEGLVSGDDVFSNNLELNGSNWADYYTTLSTSGEEEVDVRLTIPVNYTGAGVKTGDLTFWAIAAD